MNASSSKKKIIQTSLHCKDNHFFDNPNFFSIKYLKTPAILYI